MIKMEPDQLRRMLADAMEMGVNKTLIETGVIKQHVSRSEAYRRYGRKTVDRWIADRIIKPKKSEGRTSTIRLDRMELEMAAKSNF